MEDGNDENEAPNQMQQDMPSPPHPYEVMWQACICLDLAPIVAQEFVNNDIYTIDCTASHQKI